MKYILSNREYEVSEISVSYDGTGLPVVSIVDIIDEIRLPFSVRFSNDRDKALTSWFMRRIIPDHRDGIGRFMAEFGADLLAVSLQYYGQSISDGYWVKPVDSSVKWEDIDYRKHGFPLDIGNFISGASDVVVHDFLHCNSPDLTTNGQLRKVWRKQGDDFYLLKFGSAPEFMEPYNEKAASLILEKSGCLPFVKYDVDMFSYQNSDGLIRRTNTAFSVCKSFLNPYEEYVPAVELYNISDKKGDGSRNDVLICQCKKFEIPGFEKFLAGMDCFDYIIGNTDRHLGNFGFIYNIKDNKFTGPAPIFDNGTSLFGDGKEVPDERGSYEWKIVSGIYFSFNDKNIFNDIHFDIPVKEVKEILSKGCGEERAGKITALVEKRAKSYEKMILSERSIEVCLDENER